MTIMNQWQNHTWLKNVNSYIGTINITQCITIAHATHACHTRSILVPFPSPHVYHLPPAPGEDQHQTEQQQHYPKCNTTTTKQQHSNCCGCLWYSHTMLSGLLCAGESGVQFLERPTYSIHAVLSKTLSRQKSVQRYQRGPLVGNVHLVKGPLSIAWLYQFVRRYFELFAVFFIMFCWL